MVKKEIKTAKKAVDTGQEKLAEGMAGVAVQQPSPDIGMKVPEIMNPPEGMQEGSGEAADAEVQQAQQPSPDPEADQREEQAGQSGRKHVTTYKITCRNRISKVIGGVSFVNGVGYTNDGFTASWFGNKDGYEVKGAGS